LEDVRPTPEAVLEVKQMHRLIREQVAQLPEKYRVPLVYAAIDGLDYGTIAAMLDMPVGTVKTLVFRAKQQIRERIGHVLQRTAGGAS
jgi:RNA polymerase sigma-70 factor (ECF subfamily)